MRHWTTDSDLDSPLGSLFEPAREESTLDRRTAFAQLRHDLLDAHDGLRLGRFTILGRLGRGAQGSVYAAYDPRLDRSVALKVSRARGTRALAKLESEARCLARLRHPNLVTVHSLEECEGRPVVVMERIEGVPLATWVRDARPSASALAIMLAGIADGLAAMHEAGLVHRDVKPNNILVEEGGRARLVDLGLAVDLGDGGERRAVGTPGFVAPEQLSGGALSPAADVYGLAATLHAAIVGEPPPGSPAPAAIALPGSTPRWLARWIRRGLAARPEDRPDIQRFALELRRGPLRVRRWLALGATLTLACSGAALALAADDISTARCAERAAELSAVWSDATRSSLREHIVAVGPTGADDLADRTVAGLDGWVDGWSADARTLCSAEPRDGVIVARERCLDAAAEHARALVPLVLQLDVSVAHMAPTLVATLPRTDACMDASWSEEQLRRDYDVLPLVLEARARAVALRRRCEATQRSGCADDFSAIEANLSAIDACQWEPYLKLERAALASGRGEYEAALAIFEDAAFSAESCQQGAVELSAKRAVADLLTSRLGRHDEARRWLRATEAAIDRLGRPALERLELMSAQTNLAYAEGRFTDSKALAQEALARFDELRGTDIGDRADLLAALGIAEAELEDYASARRHLSEAALAIEEKLGPEHPAVALALGNLSTVVYVDSLEEALALNDRVLAIYARWPDALQPERAAAHAQRAAYSLEGRDHEDALRHAAEALAIMQRAHGPSHFRVAQIELLIATILLRMGHLHPALGFAESAARSSRATQGVDHPDTIAAARTLSEAHAVLEGRLSVKFGD